MKKTFKSLITLIIVLGTFNSCSNDSTEDKLPTNNLTTLIDDEQFISFVNSLLENTDRVINPELIINTIEKEGDLSEQDYENLSQAMGFNDITQMENYFTPNIKDWLDLVNKFDLENQDQKTLALVFREATQNIRETDNDANKQSLSKVPCGDFCLDGYYLDLTAHRTFNELLLFFCGKLFFPGYENPNNKPTFEQLRWSRCYLSVLTYMAALEVKRRIALILCEQEECNI